MLLLQSGTPWCLSLFSLPLRPTVDRGADPAEVTRARELTCPSPSAAFGSMNHASHLGSTVELAGPGGEGIWEPTTGGMSLGELVLATHLS